MKVRIQFAKDGFSQYLGHLDVMRYFQKLMRRAEIDICYTTGFSPHQVMSFGNPLGLGQTSDGEYMDIEVNSFPFGSAKEAVDHINKFGSEGIRALNCCILPEDVNNAMASVSAASYLVRERENVSVERKATFVSVFDQPDRIAAFFAQEDIVVLKKTKKSETETDIRPMIYEWSFDENKKELYLFVSAGSVANLKPELVLQALHEFCQAEFDSMQYAVHRIDTYMDATESMNKRFCTLLEAGEPI